MSSVPQATAGFVGYGGAHGAVVRARPPVSRVGLKTTARDWRHFAMARSLEDAAHEEVQIAASAVHHILKDALFNKQPSIDAAITTQAKPGVAKVKFAALEVMTEDDTTKLTARLQKTR